MEQPSRLSASVIAAAVVAMVGSVLFFLSCAAAVASILLIPPSGSAQNLPPFAKTLSIGMTAVMICVSIFGFVTGIGLLRLKNWARISAIVWGGFCIFLGVIGIPIVLLMPFGQMPNAPTVEPGVFSLVRVFLIIVYGVPLAIGVWWLILFNRKNIKAKFAGAAPSASLTAEARPRCPVAITVLAWFFIGSAANIVIYPFFPFRMPLILFGYIFPGVSMTSFVILSCLLLLVAGIGLLKLQRWSYPFAIGLQLLFLTNGVLTFLNPNFERVMADVIKQTNNAMHLSDGILDSSHYTHFLHVTTYGGLLFPVVILVLLFYYRERFLQAVDARRLQEPPRLN
jgi:hypothetical protein